MPPPRPISDPKSRMDELEKDNSFMAVASSYLGLEEDKEGPASTKDAKKARVHLGKAVAQHEKLFRDSLKVRKTVAAKEKKARLLKEKSKPAPRKKVAEVAAIPTADVKVTDVLQISASLTAWLSGTYEELTTVTGIPLGPNLAYLTAPSPQALRNMHLLVAAAPTSAPMAPHLCSVCQLPAKYKCPKCRAARFCSVECGDIHEDMRCNKFVAD